MLIVISSQNAVKWCVTWPFFGYDLENPKFDQYFRNFIRTSVQRSVDHNLRYNLDNLSLIFLFPIMTVWIEKNVFDRITWLINRYTIQSDWASVHYISGFSGTFFHHLIAIDDVKWLHQVIYKYCYSSGLRLNAKIRNPILCKIP